MRSLVLLSALSMPAVAWLTQRGVFGPEIGELADRYPTLLAAAGYAFSIWGLIFLLDALFGVWTLTTHREISARLRPAAALGFALTAAWMPVFSLQLFWLALIVIWASLACLAYCAVSLSRGSLQRGERWLAWAPLSLHAGWLSLAVFLNTAQVIVAYRLLSTEAMLPWSMVLLAGAAALLLALNARMSGNVPYTAAALWGLIAVYVEQARAALPGSQVTAWAAIAIAALLCAQTVYLRMRARRGRPAPEGAWRSGGRSLGTADPSGVLGLFADQRELFRAPRSSRGARRGSPMRSTTARTAPSEGVAPTPCPE